MQTVMRQMSVALSNSRIQRIRSVSSVVVVRITWTVEVFSIPRENWRRLHVILIAS